MDEKISIKVPLLILITVGLFFVVQPTQAGFFGWVKSIFFLAEVSEPVKEVLPSPEPEEISEKTLSETPECPACEPKTVIKEVPKEIIKEVIKEVPVEKIVYRDNVIYKESQDCQIALTSCNVQRKEVFDLYYQYRDELTSCKATTTDLVTSYKGLLTEFEELISLTRQLNRDYVFSSIVAHQIDDYFDFASSSRAFIEKLK